MGSTHSASYSALCSANHSRLISEASSWKKRGASLAKPVKRAGASAFGFVFVAASAFAFASAFALAFVFVAASAAFFGVTFFARGVAGMAARMPPLTALGAPAGTSRQLGRLVRGRSAPARTGTAHAGSHVALGAQRR